MFKLVRMKETAEDAALKKQHLPLDSSESRDGIKLIQAGVCFLLCALIAALGSWFYIKLNNEELSKFKSQFTSASLSITTTVSDGIQRKIVAASLGNSIYGYAIQGGCDGIMPNFTLSGYESIMENIITMSGLRLMSFSPLVTPQTRGGWEQYAKENVGLLHGPSYLNVSTAGSWVVADGIYNLTANGQVKSNNYIPGSLYPTFLFPVWQTAPIKLYGRAVMFDPHELSGSRIKTIDRMIKSKSVESSDVIHLVVDGPSLRPSTLLYGPVLSLESGNPVIGLLALGFSWDDVLRGIAPSNFVIDCVVSTATSKIYLPFFHFPFCFFCIVLYRIFPLILSFHFYFYFLPFFT